MAGSLVLLSAPKLAFATSFPIVAKYIEATHLKLDWDGINNAACEDGVECDPDDPLSYVLDVNTGEQRDVLHFSDMGYNIALIDWSTPLEVGHTYLVQMHGPSGFYRISQEFVYTPTAPTNVPDGVVAAGQFQVADTTSATFDLFTPALPPVDQNCLLNGVSDLSIDVYVNGVNRETITGNCTYGVTAPDELYAYTSTLFGSGDYYFVVHSASTGNTWQSNDYGYTAPPPFTVSNLTLNHATGQ